MYTKVETLELLSYIKKTYAENKLPTPEHERTHCYSCLAKFIYECETAEDAYLKLGKRNSVLDSNFNNIVYKEDCYEYFIENGFTVEEAEEMTNIMSSGRYRLTKKPLPLHRLSQEFINWAPTVFFLVTRTFLFRIFYREYEEYTFVNKCKPTSIKREFKDVEDRFNNYMLSHPDTVYTEDMVKGKSSMIDGSGNKVVVTDWLASKLLETNLLENVKPIEMPTGKTYLIKSHTGEPTTNKSDSKRHEEHLALGLFNHRKYHKHAKHYVADYQVPICRSSEVKGNKELHLGKIDLIYVAQYDEIIYLTELKEHTNDKESLLRCVCEIYTYFKQIDKLRLINEFSKEHPEEFYNNYKVVPAVMVAEGSLQHLQFRSSQFANVQQLMKKLGIRFFIIKSDAPYSHDNLEKYLRYCEIRELPVEVIK